MLKWVHLYVACLINQPNFSMATILFYRFMAIYLALPTLINFWNSELVEFLDSQRHFYGCWEIAMF